MALRAWSSPPLLAVLVVGLLLVLATAAPVAEAKPCGSTTAGGRTFIVGGGGATCTFMRAWTRRYVTARREPRGWDCRYRGGRGGCEKRRSRAFFLFYPPH